MKPLYLIFAYGVLGTAMNVFADDYLMAGLGDSISAATFADHSAERSAGSSYQLTFQNWIPLLGHLENKDTLSWVSGTSIESHYVRLRKYLGAMGDNLSVLNVSVAGARVIDLQTQVQQITAAMQSGNYRSLKYVTLMIGANDACMGTPNDQMAIQLRAIFAALASVTQTDPVRVMVSSIPKIPDLGRDEIAEMRTVGHVTCEKLRDEWIKECSLTVWQTPEEYDQKVALVVEKNKVLENVVAAVQNDFSNLEVLYSDLFYQSELPANLMARDCFHPNAEGQQEIAKKSWEALPWFK